MAGQLGPIWIKWGPKCPYDCFQIVKNILKPWKGGLQTTHYWSKWKALENSNHTIFSDILWFVMNSDLKKLRFPHVTLLKNVNTKLHQYKNVGLFNGKLCDQDSLQKCSFHKVFGSTKHCINEKPKKFYEHPQRRGQKPHSTLGFP